jgi:hypothetical protein
MAQRTSIAKLARLTKDFNVQPNVKKYLKYIALTLCFAAAFLVLKTSQSSKIQTSFDSVSTNSAPESHAAIHQPDFYKRSSNCQPLDGPPGETPSLTVAIALSEEFGGDRELSDLMTFDDLLEKPLLDTGSGRWVGHETGGGQRTIGFEGSDANKMFEDMAPILVQQHWSKGSFIEINYGKPSMRLVRLALPLAPTQSDKSSKTQDEH